MVDGDAAAGWGQVAQLEGHPDAISSVCWSPDGSRLASAGADRTVRVWGRPGEVGLHRPLNSEIGLRRSADHSMGILGQ